MPTRAPSTRRHPSPWTATWSGSKKSTTSARRIPPAGIPASRDAWTGNGFGTRASSPRTGCRAERDQGRAGERDTARRSGRRDGLQGPNQEMSDHGDHKERGSVPECAKHMAFARDVIHFRINPRTSLGQRIHFPFESRHASFQLFESMLDESAIPISTSSRRRSWRISGFNRMQRRGVHRKSSSWFVSHSQTEPVVYPE